MKRHRIGNTELTNLGKRMEYSTQSIIKPQSSPLTIGEIIDSIFRFKGIDVDVLGKDYTTSSAQGYLEQSKIFTKEYLSALADPTKRSAAGKLKFMGLTEEAVRESAELIVQSENLNLSLLNKDVADELYAGYRQSALHIDNMFKSLGMPSISLPSESPYKHFLRYLIDPYAGTNPSDGIHPMILNLMRTSFNPSHDATTIEDFSTGRGRMRSPFSLERLHERSKKFFPEGVPTSLKEGSSKPMNHLGFDRGKEYTILTWDTETTGLTPDSQIREIALVRRKVMYDDSGKMIVTQEPEVISATSKSFKSKLMDIAGYVDGDGKSVPLSEAAFIAERGGLDKVDPAELAKFRSAFEKDGVEAVSEFKQILKYFLNEDDILGIGGGIENLRIEGHNAESFDIDKFISTVDGLPAYHEDSEAKRLLKKFLTLRSQKANYVLDTLDSAKITFAIQQSKLSNILAGAGMSDELITGLISSFSMSPEMFGATKGSESLENIMLNTNFFELLETRISDSKSKTLINLMENRGTHTAQVDTMLNSYVSDFINSNELHIRRLPTAGMPPAGLSPAAAREYVEKQSTLEGLFKNHGFMKENRSMSAFEAFMRARISKSSAVTPVTNVSDLSRMSENVFNYLQTEAGSEKISLRVDANYLQRLKDVGDADGPIDLGISLADIKNEQNAAGRIFYNKKSKKFAFSNFEALGVGEDVPEGITRGYQELDTDLVRRAFNLTLDDAKGGVGQQVPILNSTQSVTVNAAREALANMSLTEIEATELDQMMAARGALSTLGRSTPLSTNATVLSQALGTTTEFYGKADGSFFPALVGEHTTAYSKALLERGLPYATLDVRSRILATAEAKATSGIGAKAIEILLSAGDDTYRGLGDNVTAAKVAKLSDIGLQFAISQGKEQSFGLKYLGKNQEIIEMTDVNSYFRTPVSDPTGVTTKASRVIMTGDDISELMIREFDEETGNVIGDAIKFGSPEFIPTDLNRFKDSVVQSNEINATINRAFAPKNLSEKTIEDLAEQVLTLNTRAYKRLTDNAIRPHISLQNEAATLARNIFGPEGGSSKAANRLAQLQEMAELGTREERMAKLASYGVDEAEKKMFVNNYRATVKTIAESIETNYITGFKISGEEAVRAMVDSRSGQGLSSATTDIGLQGRTSRMVAPLATKEKGVIAAIFSPSVTDDVDRGVRNLTGETLNVGVARAAEDSTAHKAFIDSASLIDDITEVLPGATDESKFVAQSLQKGRSLYAANKGKFALGALALAGAVTGYKMAKRGNENDLYNATMGPAPVEQGQRPYGIQEALMGNGQTSRRKDPLFTAGIVGNLDRQKIGHTSMGSNKNSHLFGDR